MVNEMTGYIAIALLAVVMLGGFYFISTQIKAPEVSVSTYPETKGILATGTSSTKVSPDLLLINLGVETQNKTAADSQAANAAKMDAIKNALKAQGLTDNDIKTSHFRVEAVREKSTKCQVGYSDTSTCPKVNYYPVVGYKTTHILSLNVENLDSGGAILDAASGAGANRIDSISFTLKQNTRRTLQEQQLALAAQDAKNRAGKIASGLGVNLGLAKTASESVAYYTYQPKYDFAEAMAAPSAAPSTDLSSGEVEVRATVSATFELQ
jgi:uncharacterized protein YggE